MVEAVLTVRIATMSTSVRPQPDPCGFRAADAVFGGDTAAEVGDDGEHGLGDTVFVGAGDVEVVDVDIAVADVAEQDRTALHAEVGRDHGESVEGLGSARIGTDTSSFTTGWWWTGRSIPCAFRGRPTGRSRDRVRRRRHAHRRCLRSRRTVPRRRSRNRHLDEERERAGSATGRRAPYSWTRSIPAAVMISAASTISPRRDAAAISSVVAGHPVDGQHRDGRRRGRGDQREQDLGNDRERAFAAGEQAGRS